MMQVRVFTAAVLVAAGLLGTGAAARAADPLYPPTAVIGGVNKAVVAPGASIAFGGSGFKPGETIAVTVRRSTAGSATGAAFTAGGGTFQVAEMTEATGLSFQAAAAGDLSVVADGLGAFQVAVPAPEAGRFVLTAVGLLTGNTLRSEVVIRASGTATEDGLPVTGPGGSHWVAMLSVGLVAILLGSVLVRQARRRRTAG